MTYKRGAIYLANFNPSKGKEPGKVRPCLVVQTDALNDARHGTIAVLPLTTQLMEDAYPMRYTVKARDELRQDSQVMVDQMRAIDKSRFTSGTLTVLPEPDLADIEKCLKIVLGFGD